MKTPLRYPGGKSRAVKHILPYIPEDCEKLCAPFLGGGSIELAVAERGTKVYGYDIFKPLVWFWKALLKNPEKLSQMADLYRIKKTYMYKEEEVKARGLPKEDFERFRREISHALKNEEPFSYEMAAKVYAINRSSFSGATLSGGWSERASYARFTDTSIERIRDFKEKNLTVRCQDFRNALRKHADCFLYCDPPYYMGAGSKLYGNNGDTHYDFPHLELYEALRNRKNWVLSYNDNEIIRYLYRDFDIVEAEWAMGMKNVSKESRANGQMGKSSEIIIMCL